MRIGPKTGIKMTTVHPSTSKAGRNQTGGRRDKNKSTKVCALRMKIHSTVPISPS
jgi:hypothetical protein